MRGSIKLLAGLATLAASCSSGAEAKVICSGHHLHSTPRPEGSCKDVKPATFASKGGLTAYVFPVNPSLHATPDMESRVEVRARDGKVLATKSFASPKGANGYYVVQAQWTRDGQYFVFSLASSGGHSPWQAPMEVFSVERLGFVKFSAMIQDAPTLTKRFALKGDSTVIATTWTDNNFEKPRRVEVDLKMAVPKVPM